MCGILSFLVIRLRMFDVLILNRNLGGVADSLAEVWLNNPEFDGKTYVVDAGSKEKLKSKYTSLVIDNEEAKRSGLRPNRGFSLGVRKWLEDEAHSWLLLLPVDSEVVNAEITILQNKIKKLSKIGAIIPLSQNSPYTNLIGKDDIAIGWHFSEGPIMISRDLANRITADNKYFLFDWNNFRGYLNFIEFALRTYTNDFCILATTLLMINQNDDHLINNSQLIGTEPKDENLNLLVAEGIDWLRGKYGFEDRWALEWITRQAFESFLECNQQYKDLNFPA